MISLLLAVYNNIETLPHVIDSIKKELTENDQFIIIDDKSTDGTWEFLKKLEINNYSFELILQQNKVNSGLAFSLNRGINLATKEYLARIDGDDIVLPNRFKYQLNMLKNNLKIDIISSDKIEYSNVQDINRLYNLAKINLKNNYRKVKQTELLLKNRLAHPTIFGKTKIFKKYKYNGFYKGTNDYKLWLDMILNNVSLYISQTPVILYMNKRNDNKKIIRQLIESILIRLSNISICPKKYLIYLFLGCINDIFSLTKLLFKMNGNKI